MRALPRETDEQLTQRVLGYLRAAWWRFLVQEIGSRAGAGRVAPAGRPGFSQDSQPESGLVRRAAQRRDDATPSPGCSGSGRKRKRLPACRSPKPTTPRSRSSSPCARCRAGATSSRRNAAHREPRSQGPLRVRHAGALRRSRRARALVPVAAGRQQSPARAVGARRPQLPASSAARAASANTSSRASRCCGRSRRPATSSSRSDGSTARWRPQLASSCHDGAAVPRRTTLDVPRAIAEHHPAGCRRARPRRGGAVGQSRSLK